MSLFYRILYQVGFTPWEDVVDQGPVAEKISALFDREQVGRPLPYGRALDLGCGSGIHAVELARRGWQVTGIDLIPKALVRARERAKQAGLEVRFLQGDLTALQASGVGSDFRLVLDFGAVHGLTETQRETVGREMSAVAAADATLLMVAFLPRNRGPLPHGMSRADIEATYPGWKITDDGAVGGDLPWLLKKLTADPHWYRLQRR